MDGPMTASIDVLAPPEVVVEEDDEDCPGISPHPAPPGPGRTALWWIEQSRGRGRVVAYTCFCRMTTCELVCIAGSCQVRRQTLPRPGIPSLTWTAHCWCRVEAYEWWRRLLAGQAR
ncbi:hypothetical protein [Nonomuraea sp. SBT364]|uniref:hypothetical protein n=1 Tax=Nonomuraea sp. SBT364 TaxID=1580530 RepID=UPI00066A32E8|nr:hypothetical protein [Nonomuraea sp. SBT364]